MVAYTHYATDPRCRREAELCVEAGWDVDFYALRNPGRSSKFDPKGVHLREMSMDRYRGASSAAYLASYLRFLALTSLAVFRAHLQRRYDVIHVNTMPDFMILTALLPRIFGAKVVLDIHDVMPEIYMTKFQLGQDHWKIRLIRGVEVLSARLAHAVLAAEHPKRDLLVEHGIPRRKIEVLLNLPDHEIFPLNTRPRAAAPQNRDDEFRLIYHGTIAHRLGLDRAVAAMPAILEFQPGARLRVIGDGDHLPALHSLCDELGLGEVVSFSDGFLPIEEILPELMNAHLAVIPTRREVSTDYMLPTKLIEYLRLGVPAVVVPTRTVRHYFGDECPLFLEEGSPADVAAKVNWVRTNFAEVLTINRGLQEGFFSKYDWPRHKAVYLRLLDGLLS